jgi:hypothetical protein
MTLKNYSPNNAVFCDERNHSLAKLARADISLQVQGSFSDSVILHHSRHIISEKSNGIKAEGFYCSIMAPIAICAL